MTLWRLASENSPAVEAPDASGLTAAEASNQSAEPEGASTLEDVVLGYLAAGRGIGAGLQFD
jgi:hypothetical protein